MTITKTKPYDVAEHLRTPEEMAAYLDEWFDEAPEDVSPKRACTLRCASGCWRVRCRCESHGHRSWAFFNTKL